MRQVQRHGDVAQAAVHTDHPGATGQGVGQRVQPEAGPDDGVGQSGGNGVRVLLLGLAAMRQGDGITTGIEALAQSLPVCQRPLFVSTRGAMHQRHHPFGAGVRICYVFNSGKPFIYAG